jgi:manganese transport protein
MLALVPAVVVISVAGEGSTQRLLVLSQVILSLQLSFAVVPLIHFTSDRRNMGAFATPLWAQGLAWLTAAVIVGLNGWLVFGKIAEWVEQAAASGLRVGPVPLSWVVAAGLYGLAGSVLALLAWVTVKPWVKPSPAWAPMPSVQLDWVDALRSRPLETIGVALEHDQADAEILSRALSLARPGETRFVILHVVDTPLTQIYGSETADRETGADRRYLADVAGALIDLGYEARPVLLHGTDRAGQLVAQIKRDPVDLLVVGSHGHGLVRDLLLGQVVDKVRHGLDVPMLIARPDRAGAAAEAALAPPAAPVPTRLAPAEPV